MITNSRGHSESALTHTIPAERRARTSEIVKVLSFCTSTTPIPAEGRAHLRHRKKSSVFPHPPRQSPQRIARAPQNLQKVSSFCTSEGRARTSEIVKSSQFLHIDHANPRRGSRGQIRNRKKSSGFGYRPRQSPQRVSFSQGGFGPTAPPEETNQFLSCPNVSCKFGCVISRASCSHASWLVQVGSCKLTHASWLGQVGSCKLARASWLV